MPVMACAKPCSKKMAKNWVTMELNSDRIGNKDERRLVTCAPGLHLPLHWIIGCLCRSPGQTGWLVIRTMGCVYWLISWGSSKGVCYTEFYTGMHSGWDKYSGMQSPYNRLNSAAPGRCGSISSKHRFRIQSMSTSCNIAQSLMPQNTFDDKSTLVQVKAWCHQAASHYLSQCWPKSLSPCGITRLPWVELFKTPTVAQPTVMLMKWLSSYKWTLQLVKESAWTQLISTHTS